MRYCQPAACGGLAVTRSILSHPPEITATMRPEGRPADSGHLSRVSHMAQPQSLVRYEPMQERSRPWLHNEGAPIHDEGKPLRHRGSRRRHMPTGRRPQHGPRPERPTSRHPDFCKTIWSFRSRHSTSDTHRTAWHNWIAGFNPDSFFPDARILGAGFLPTDGHARPR